jgi:REP element-mobilizing transposase RayT
LDEFVVMPDHVHLVIHNNQGSSAELRQVVQGLKGLATIEARRAVVWGPEALWQRSFHDRVIREHRELDRIRIYIRENPRRGQ